MIFYFPFVLAVNMIDKQKSTLNVYKPIMLLKGIHQRVSWGYIFVSNATPLCTFSYMCILLCILGFFFPTNMPRERGIVRRGNGVFQRFGA
jgi:hypothetical protein